MQSQKDIEYLNHIFEQFCVRLNAIYKTYMETNELISKHSLGLPPGDVDVCQNISRAMQINHIKNVEILRIDLDTPLIALRAKCLYNNETEESFINFIDFNLKKIQLRGGGMGNKIVSAVFDCHKKWLADQFEIIPNYTEMGIFKFLSIPFWIKQDFYFKQMANIEEDESNHWNAIYKLFKLLIIMNEVQDLHQYVDEFDLFSLELPRINDILKKQITAYHYKLYNQNLWIKSSLLGHAQSKCCDDFETDNMEYCTKVTYKNICNQLANERLNEKIIPILWELFYLSKRV